MGELDNTAQEILQFLRKFEKSKRFSKLRNPLFYNVNAYRAGRYVSVVYVSYQGERCLTRQQAWEYLEWLRAGHVGRHYDMEKMK